MPPPPEPDDLLFRFRGAYKKQDGYVDVTARGVDWRGPDGASVSVAFADLAKHETSPKAHAKCMLKLTVPDKKPVVLTVLEASKDRAWDVLCDAKVTIATVLKRVRRTTPEARTKAAENALRADALARDGALRAEHREFVGGGVVCEADFWAARPPLATPAHAVKAAPSNELLVDAPAGGGPPSSRSRKELSFALSREKIDFLFDAYPAVRRAHAAHVPNDMSEEQFWVKYFQSRYFWRDKGAAVNNATPDDAAARGAARGLERAGRVASTLKGGSRAVERDSLRRSPTTSSRASRSPAATLGCGCRGPCGPPSTSRGRRTTARCRSRRTTRPSRGRRRRTTPSRRRRSSCSGSSTPTATASSRPRRARASRAPWPSTTTTSTTRSSTGRRRPSRRSTSRTAPRAAGPRSPPRARSRSSSARSPTTSRGPSSPSTCSARSTRPRSPRGARWPSSTARRASRTTATRRRRRRRPTSSARRAASTRSSATSGPTPRRRPRRPRSARRSTRRRAASSTSSGP
mmetsp:Transcript_34679/g.117563  ORF Transcript_34679/g.117563 Transcript_34679/m.117563 type:complete len:519 (+) Transcript_34679:155-1711(+)